MLDSYIKNSTTERIMNYTRNLMKKKMADNKAIDGTPQLEVINRVKSIPVVHSAIEKTGSTYSYLKDSHHLINWALTQAEAGLNYASATAAPLTVPLAKKFEGHIIAVDQKLCEGLNVVEQKVPIVKQPPQQIYDAAKAVMSSSLQPTIDKLHAAKESAAQHAYTFKEISINKANELLNNSYGVMAVQGVDNTSVLINGLLDRYFPPVEGEENTPAPISADENKVLHTVQTIGQLSSKTANRVYHSVVAQLKTVKKEDVASYMSSVISILHLTHFLSLTDKHDESNSANEENKEKK
ncbi:lipid storage droplets surface-binding protein 2-like isoform X1 [Bombus pyrosoma]|uniref:lipid storage droplets surface-binding protein 2-like isoform X1 n=3 Tax=Bombus pyrosoma TaxID=396416 RepID=UPI001CB8FB3E|nr:lipid storage droplets surface-binding protein 2-like isoform X1 [Bombus pyrosoma]